MSPAGFLAALAALGALIYFGMRAGNSTRLNEKPAGHAETLKRDHMRAEEAQRAANEALRRREQEIGQGLQQDPP